jgi:hypothetical protein
MSPPPRRFSTPPRTRVPDGIPLDHPSRPPYSSESLELVLDELAHVLDGARVQVESDPQLEHLAPRIRRTFEAVKILIRRLEGELAPLDREPE